MANFAGGEIEGFVGPSDLGGPDDLEAAIVEFIDAAVKTLDVAVQELDNEAIADALIRARLAGKSVRVVLNHSYLQDDDKPEGLSPTVAALANAPSEQRFNREIFSALCRCGVEVRIDFNHEHIFHQKLAVRDLRIDRAGRPSGSMPSTALLTGSTNFTTTDWHTNLNHIVIFHHRDVALEYAREFAEIYSGQFGRGEIGDVPKTYDVGGVPVKVLFAPEHGPESEIIKQTLKCPVGGEIKFAIFTFAGSSGIDDAMIVLAGAGRTISGAVDPAQGGADWAASKWISEGGVDLRVPRRQDGFRKLHHKLMTINDSTVLAGSFNYTAPANLFNDENLFVMGSPYEESEGVEVDRAACQELTGYFSSEIDRILSVSDPWRERP